MSRSRRPHSRRKCICGRLEVPFLELIGKSACHIIDDVHGWNERFIRYKLRRSRPEFEGE